MSTTRTQLPRDLESQVVRAARRLGVSRARFVREALLDRLSPPPATSNRSYYDLSRDLCGSLAGGPRNLARHKKKYLEGYGAWRR